MAISVQTTPNPAAMKFVVGVPFWGPLTATPGAESGSALADALTGIAGVASVFMTADFVTVTKTPEATWEQITDVALALIGTHHPDA